MPIHYAQRLTGPERTPLANRHLGIALAFVAGATNAGGFMALQQHTSHMSGVMAGVSEHLAVGAYELMLGGLGALLFFIMGSAFSAVLIHFARRRRIQSEYALPLLVEALLLLLFGLLGSTLAGFKSLFVPTTVALLCFTMGLQNAVITKLSHAEIRTTHITGVITDIGIEIGKLMYWNATYAHGGVKVVANRHRLVVLSLVAFSFFAGGVAGALGFAQLGYVSTVALALILLLLAAAPAIADLRELSRYWLRR